MYSESVDVHNFFETPHDNAPEQLFVITLYLDESNHSSSDSYVVVAGFRGTEEQWIDFAPKWKAALGNRSALHMSDLRWNAKGSRVKELLARLGPIPYECGLIPVYGGVRVNDYYDLVKHDSVLEQRLRGYLICLASVFCVLLETIPGHEKIKIVCEAQNEYQPGAGEFFKIYKQMAGESAKYPYFVSIEFVDKSTLLEPADYLAFALGKNLSQPGCKKDLWCRPIHAEGRKLSCRPGIWMDKKVARETIEMIKADVFSKRQIRALRSSFLRLGP